MTVTLTEEQAEFLTEILEAAACRYRNQAERPSNKLVARYFNQEAEKADAIRSLFQPSTCWLTDEHPS